MEGSGLCSFQIPSKEGPDTKTLDAIPLNHLSDFKENSAIRYNGEVEHYWWSPCSLFSPITFQNDFQRYRALRAPWSIGNLNELQLLPYTARTASCVLECNSTYTWEEMHWEIILRVFWIARLDSMEMRNWYHWQSLGVALHGLRLLSTHFKKPPEELWCRKSFSLILW